MRCPAELGEANISLGVILESISETSEGKWDGMAEIGREGTQ
jgi:hypothetical protein